jgi:DtxR family Mn-dependent transcriptional regulator
MPEILSNLLLAAAITGVVVALAAWWPRHGLVAWRRNRRAAGRQTLREDVLKHLCKSAASGRRPTLQSVSGVLQLTAAQAAGLLQEMEGQGLVSFSSGDLQLTPAGRKAGLHIIRAHRLWECYLADQTGLREREWHARAERREHRMTPAEADALASELGNPTHDPHGDPIPTADGVLEPDAGRPLATLEAGESAWLAHIEDEPENLYAELAAKGLRAGMTVTLLEKSAQTVRFTANGDEHALDPILAHQLEVLPLAEVDDLRDNLAAFAPGKRVTVLGLARSCRGPERRRLLDLGFVAGTTVEVAMVSPSGEPTAYRVRGTLIALHREQARLVMVEPEIAIAS